MLKASDGKSRTLVVGHTRSPELNQLDDTLAAYGANATPQTLAALVAAIEQWSGAKQAAAPGGGYAALLKGARNKSGAVQQLCTEVRRLAGKPAYWPDASQGATYVADLDEATVGLLRDMRFKATRISVEMIAAMNVDWASFAFDQLGAASSMAINLGHTNYGAGWAGAQNNQTSAGQLESHSCAAARAR